ncbi:unnamed protein product, partial [marine sediment metagenome]
MFSGGTTASAANGLAIYNNNGVVDVTNSTFANHLGDPTDSVVYSHMQYGGSTTITNSILWNDNVAEIGGVDGVGTVTVSYSDVQGGYTGTGNINRDPLFVNAADSQNGGLALDIGSPCWDAGEDDNVIGSEDITGAPREVDVPGIGTVDVPPEETDSVDMGAYEHQYELQVTVDSLHTADHTPELIGTVTHPHAGVAVTVNGNQYLAANNGDG